MTPAFFCAVGRRDNTVSILFPATLDEMSHFVEG